MSANKAFFWKKSQDATDSLSGGLSTLHGGGCPSPAALTPVWPCDFSWVAPGPVSITFHTTSHPPPLASGPHPIPVPGPQGRPSSAAQSRSGLRRNMLEALLKHRLPASPDKASDAGRPDRARESAFLTRSRTLLCPPPPEREPHFDNRGPRM